MIPLDKDGAIDMKNATINDLAVFFSAMAMDELMLNGGRGLRAAIREAIWAGIAFQKEQGSK